MPDRQSTDGTQRNGLSAGHNPHKSSNPENSPTVRWHGSIDASWASFLMRLLPLLTPSGTPTGRGFFVKRKRPQPVGKPHWGARCRRRHCRTLMDAALPVSIVGLQDADKVRHAGPIPVIGRDWHLKIWCGLALPKPPHEIGNLLHGAHSERGA